jgi:hypothetical protein
MDSIGYHCGCIGSMMRGEMHVVGDSSIPLQMNVRMYMYVWTLLTVMHVIDSFVGPSVGMWPSPTVVRTAPGTRLTFHITVLSHVGVHIAFWSG